MPDDPTPANPPDDADLDRELEAIVGDAGLLRQPPRPGFEFVTGADREKQMVSGDPGAADWTVVLRGTGGSEDPASKLPPCSWLSPWRQMGPSEVAWDVEVQPAARRGGGGVLIYVPGEERPIDAGDARRRMGLSAGRPGAYTESWGVLSR
jgi:hypothetical protein